MQFWLYRGFGAVASQSAGAGASSYCFWFYGGMQVPSSGSVTPANFYFQFLTTG